MSAISDYLNRKIPPYYDTMYLDGFTPSEILQSVHQTMYAEFKEKNDFPSVKIISEIKKKWKPTVKKIKRRKIRNQF